MQDEPIQLDTSHPLVAVVTLSRPPVNALGTHLREQLIRRFDELQDREDVRAIVLTGAGNIFSAGADIKEKQTLDAEPGGRARANRLIRESFFCLVDSKKPVIAAVNGAALGAGFVMAACCDVILAAEGAFFGMPEIDVGQGGGASFLQRILTIPVMRSMLLTGERIPASDMYRLGVIQQCLPMADLLPAAVGIASTIARKSPAAVQAIRGSFSAVEALDLREGFHLEQDYTTDLSGSPDAQEARRAFLEKRDPKF